MSDRQLDEYGRAIFADREVPDPFDPSSRFAQWHGRTCGPWTVISGLADTRHRYICDHGWTRSGDWSFVCGRCHPDARDMPGSGEHQRRPADPEDGA